MDRFSKLHPAMQFLFFIITIVLVITINNPVFSAISLLCALIYSFVSRGRKAFKSLKTAPIIIAMVSIFNMLFAHYGEDVLFSIGETAFTLEALFYGFNQGMVLSAVILWFSVLSETIDSERVIYLFRLAPKCALIFSMVLGFIPRFTRKLEDIRDAGLALSGGERPVKLRDRLKAGISELSALVTYSLESSIITADSMEARGYNPRAIRSARYKMSVSDYVLIFVISGLAINTLVQLLLNRIVFVFEPIIYIESLDASAVACYAVLGLVPTVVDLSEEVLWKLSNAKG